MVSYPIIITGAGRSGTKLLRSILGSHPRIVIFPREINYIWRHGNAQFPTDELTPDCARPDVIRYIQKQFTSQSNRHNNRRIVEKTCANSLRLQFVHSVFPNAFVIHLVRDGRAVAESARRRWLAPPDPVYLAEKLRWMPVPDIPYYGLRYLRFCAGGLDRKCKGPSSWGPRFSGMDELVASMTLLEVCGIQWSRCVEAAERAMTVFPSARTATIHYEDLVIRPLDILPDLFEKMQLAFMPSCQQYVMENVSRQHLRKWQSTLSQTELDLLLPHITPTLIQFGYQLDQHVHVTD